MADDERGQRGDEGPRVRVRPRPGRRAQPLRTIAGEVRAGLREVEQRFLTVQAEAEARPPADVLADYLALLGRVRDLYVRLEDTSGRRDVSYGMHLRLEFLHGACRWLARRISAEVVLAMQVQLEQRFRQVVDADAYQVYLRLEELTDAGREIEALSDRELLGRLRDGTLVRDVLETLRLADVLPWRGQVGPPP